MPIRITGLNSGLDTEAIISALVSSYNYKTEKYKKAQTKLSWKQDAWKTLNTKIYSLYNNVGSMRFSTAYNLKATTCSDSTKATVSAGSSAPNGTQKLNIIQIAQAGYLTGGKLDDSTTTGTTLAELGYTGGDGKITVTKGDGSATEISVSQGTTVNSFINSLKKAGLTANYDDVNKRIFVSSEKTGADNDFTLTGANVDGANALYALGLNVQSDATDATYASYTKYYADTTAGIEANVADALAAYEAAMEAYETASAQNANLSASYGYASAYSAMMDALNQIQDEGDREKLRTLLGMTATERVNSVMDAYGNVYTKSGKDADGNTVFVSGEGVDAKYITKVDTYADASGNTYTLNDDKNLVGEDGTVYKTTGKKDDDGNTIYKTEDGTEVAIKTTSTYYEATASEEGTGMYKVADADGNEYTQSEVDGAFVAKDGTKYRLMEDGTLAELDDEGNVKADGKIVTVAPNTNEEIMKTVYTKGAEASGVARSADVLTQLKEDNAIEDDDVKTLTSNIATVKAFEKVEDTVLDDADPYSRASLIAKIQGAYADSGADAVNGLVNSYAAVITANKETMKTSQDTMDKHTALASIAAMEDGTEKDNAIASFVTQVQEANNITSATNYNTDAKKIDGQDAIIKLNGVEYTGESNSFSINGLNIMAQSETGDGDANAITITTQTDTQAIYDKVKDFLTQYNALINEITSLYNADSAKGYEPLTDEERDSLSDTEIEKWEEKIKSSLLRRDDSLESVMNAMTSSMSKGIEIDGKMYYLSSFGINTLGFLNAPENEQNAYHINGDEDDTATAGKADKLMAAIVSDPDTVVEFMQKLSTNLYNAVGDKMKSTTLRSTYTVYNDKEMASEYSDYTDLIKKWEEKLTEQEDYWYNKFSAMETALSKLNSQTSSLTSMLG